MERAVTDSAIDRIRQMELCLDALQEAENENPVAIYEDPHLQKLHQNLTRYYESGQWLHDYTLDETGLLPQDLKRGVLAQDTVYDLLARIKNTDIKSRCPEQQ